MGKHPLEHMEFGKWLHGQLETILFSIGTSINRAGVIYV